MVKLNGKKYLKKEMLMSRNKWRQNYQFRTTEMGRSWQKIFIGFKKNKNSILVPEDACQVNFYALLGEFKADQVL